MINDLATFKGILRDRARVLKVQQDRLGMTEDFLGYLGDAGTSAVLPDGNISILVRFDMSEGAFGDGADFGDPGPAMIEPDPVDVDVAIEIPQAVSAQQVATLLKTIKKMPETGLTRGSPKGPWSDSEKDCARQMIKDGAASADIADHLGRSRAGTSAVVSKLAEKLAEEELAAQRATPAPVDVVDVVKPAPEPVFDRSPEDRLRKQWADYLDGLGNDGIWTVQRDYDLVTSLARGRKAAHLAQEMEIAKADVIARFRALYRHEGPSIEAQAYLVKTLEARLQEGA